MQTYTSDNFNLAGFDTFDIGVQYFNRTAMIKQSRYDEAKNTINQLYTEVFNGPLSRQENIDMREQYKKQIEDDIKKISGMDLTNQKNLEAASRIFTPFLENKYIARDMSFTKSYYDAMERGQSLKASHSDLAWDGMTQLLNLQMEEFQNATNDETLSMGNLRYIEKPPIVDEIWDLLKEDYNVEQNFPQNEKGQDYKWILSMKNGSLSFPYLSALLGYKYNDRPDVTDFFMAKATLEYKQSMKNNQGDSDLFVRETIKKMTDEDQKRKNKNKDVIKVIENSVKLMEKELSMTTDENRIATIQQNLQDYKLNIEHLTKELENTEKNIRLASKLATEYDADLFLSLYSNYIKQSELSDIITAFSYKNSKEEYKANQYELEKAKPRSSGSYGYGDGNNNITYTYSSDSNVEYVTISINGNTKKVPITLQTDGTYKDEFGNTYRRSGNVLTKISRYGGTHLKKFQIGTQSDVRNVNYSETLNQRDEYNKTPDAKLLFNTGDKIDEPLNETNFISFNEVIGNTPTQVDEAGNLETHYAQIKYGPTGYWRNFYQDCQSFQNTYDYSFKKSDGQSVVTMKNNMSKLSFNLLSALKDDMSNLQPITINVETIKKDENGNDMITNESKEISVDDQVSALSNMFIRLRELYYNNPNSDNNILIHALEHYTGSRSLEFLSDVSTIKFDAVNALYDGILRYGDLSQYERKIIDYFFNTSNNTNVSKVAEDYYNSTDNYSSLLNKLLDATNEYYKYDNSPDNKMVKEYIGDNGLLLSREQFKNKFQLTENEMNVYWDENGNVETSVQYKLGQILQKYEQEHPGESLLYSYSTYSNGDVQGYEKEQTYNVLPIPFNESVIALSGYGCNHVLFTVTDKLYDEEGNMKSEKIKDKNLIICPAAYYIENNTLQTDLLKRDQYDNLREQDENQIIADFVYSNSASFINNLAINLAWSGGFKNVSYCIGTRDLSGMINFSSGSKDSSESGNKEIKNLMSLVARFISGPENTEKIGDETKPRSYITKKDIEKLYTKKSKNAIDKENNVNNNPFVQQAISDEKSRNASSGIALKNIKEEDLKKTQDDQGDISILRGDNGVITVRLFPSFLQKLADSEDKGGKAMESYFYSQSDQAIKLPKGCLKEGITIQFNLNDPGMEQFSNHPLITENAIMEKEMRLALSKSGYTAYSINTNNNNQVNKQKMKMNIERTGDNAYIFKVDGSIWLPLKDDNGNTYIYEKPINLNEAFNNMSNYPAKVQTELRGLMKICNYGETVKYEDASLSLYQLLNLVRQSNEILSKKLILK